MAQQFRIGQIVHVLGQRSQSGCWIVPVSNLETPSNEATDPTVARPEAIAVKLTVRNVCGVRGCWGGVWASDGGPVGLPLYAHYFLENVTC